MCNIHLLQCTCKFSKNSILFGFIGFIGPAKTHVHFVYKNTVFFHFKADMINRYFPFNVICDYQYHFIHYVKQTFYYTCLVSKLIISRYQNALNFDFYVEYRVGWLKGLIQKLKKKNLREEYFFCVLKFPMHYIFSFLHCFL